MQAAEWGPFVFVNVNSADGKSLTEFETEMQPLLEDFKKMGDYSSLHWGGEISIANLIFILIVKQARKIFTLNCNWKLVNDNYLDGEYHIPYVHPGKTHYRTKW